MPGAQEFGGSWTEKKLELLRKYMRAYMTIFTGNRKASFFTTIYMDAFAGTGYRLKTGRQPSPNLVIEEFNEPEMVEFLKGSARIALELDPSFKKYIFVERGTENVNELLKLKSEFQDKAYSIKVIKEDANAYLQQWCADTDWRSNRAVVFLDPFGMEVNWETIESIANTKAIDLWVLFPLSVNRLLTRDKQPDAALADRLTRVFGTEEWKQEFYTKRLDHTLFGPEELEGKDADIPAISAFFIKQLKLVFADANVANNPYVLRNSKNSPLYLLCFAAGNPDKGPLGVKIAQHILRG
jgi:three-Cys-motif partner protein